MIWESWVVLGIAVLLIGLWGRGVQQQLDGLRQSLRGLAGEFYAARGRLVDQPQVADLASFQLRDAEGAHER